MARTQLGTFTGRKIEQAMVQAACDIRDWRESNTEVKAAVHAGLPVAEVFLHGNHIANLMQVRHDTMQLMVVESTLANWPTMTTISRLRALGAHIECKRGHVYLNGNYIATKD